MNNGTDDDKNGPIPPPEEPAEPTGESEPAPPNERMDYYELGTYIRQQFGKGQALEDESVRIGRRSAVHWWLAGQALDIVHGKEKKEQNWKAWCNNHSLNLDTCYQALRLYRRSGSIEKVRELSITEARSYYQTAKAKWKLPAPAPQDGEPQGGETTIEANAGTPTTEATAATGATETTIEATTEADATEGHKPLGILGRLQHDLEELETVADDLAKPDAAFEEADAAIAVKRIDAVLVKLREARKVLQARVKVMAKSSVKARGKVGGQVGDDR